MVTMLKDRRPADPGPGLLHVWMSMNPLSSKIISLDRTASEERATRKKIIIWLVAGRADAQCNCSPICLTPAPNETVWRTIFSATGISGKENSSARTTALRSNARGMRVWSCIGCFLFAAWIVSRIPWHSPPRLRSKSRNNHTPPLQPPFRLDQPRAWRVLRLADGIQRRYI